ncbi:MAG: biopolymer transporter ExbD [Bdellovibrionaceae bacterium]|nr:biopolymer transporter ExbD [Pseudobdellovibrionaceae bacterium]
MPIYKPGERYRYNRLLRRRKTERNLVALLSLTAMVDMFTVLVVFLLQNFSGEQQMLILHKDIQLPRAASIKDLKPAFVVTVANSEVLLDQVKVTDLASVQASEDWMIQPLFETMKAALEKGKADYEARLQTKIRGAVGRARGEKDEDPNAWNKVTIQADRAVDILTIKKILYTITEAGAGEINFAVLKLKKDGSNN